MQFNTSKTLVLWLQQICRCWLQQQTQTQGTGRMANAMQAAALSLYILNMTTDDSSTTEISAQAAGTCAEFFIWCTMHPR